MRLVHKHLIVRANVHKPFVDIEETKEWLKKIVSLIGMNITEHGGPHVDYVNKEGNCGIAGIVMIETSHFSLHLWDKQNPPLLQMDVYSCSEYDHGLILANLDIMEPYNIDWILIDREKKLDLIKQSDFL